MNSPSLCQHCGNPFTATPAEPDFCCAGCSFVHGLILAGGMERFYDLRGSATLIPAGNAVLLPAHTDWAEKAQADAENAGGAEQVEAVFDLQGVSCIGCVWLIDAAFSAEPGAVRCVADPSRGSLTLRWCRGVFSLPEFVRRLAAFGYRLSAGQGGEASASGASGMKLGLCGAMAMNGMAFTLPRYAGMDALSPLAGTFEAIAAFSATVSLLIGGGYFIPRAWTALRLGRIHIDVPISLGIITAWVGSVAGWLVAAPGMLYFDFVAMFIFLMLLGRRLQEISAESNRRRLLRQDPGMRDVEILDEDSGGLQPRPPSDLRSGHEFRLPSGAALPVAARLCADRALFSLDWISGEAEPIQYAGGAIIPSGAIHLGGGPLSLVACENWSDSLMARLVAADPAKASDNAAARWLDRALRVYLACVLGAAFLGAAVWLCLGDRWTQGVQVFVSVLVVSCPCALGVAVPLAHDMAVTRLRRLGVFIRSPDLWGRLRRVRKVVFDKTGTLTLENPRLAHPEILTELPPAARRALAILAGESRHPVCAALREALAGAGLLHPEAGARAEEICGYGLRHADADGAVWELRRPPDREAGNTADGDEPFADTLLTRDGETVAGFRFLESGRADAAEIIDHFQRRGTPVYVLSGDRHEKVNAMAAALGIPSDHAFARLTPSEKGDWMAARGGDALFIGDGANDTLAAQTACCSGSLAVDRTLMAENSDFYFLSRSLKPLRSLFETAEVHRSAVRRAFFFAVTYNLGAVTLALRGMMNPLLAAILMPLSSLATIAIVVLTVNPPARKRRAEIRAPEPVGRPTPA